MNDNPRTTDTMQKITNTTPTEDILDDSVEEMISKATVDEYIEERVNQLFADKQKMELDERIASRKVEEEVIVKYNEVMQNSKEPWVDLNAYTESENGLKIGLDWNDAFVDYLRAAGMSGIDDEQIVHTWLAMLMKDVTNNTEDSIKGDFED